MAQYSYQTQDNQTKYFESALPQNEAIKEAPKDIGKTSGIQLVNNNQQENLTSKTNQLLGGNYFDVNTGKQIQNIQNPIVAPETKITGTPAPELPPQTSPAINETYQNTLSAEAEKNRKALEDAYNKQIADMQSKIEASNKKIEELNTLQQEGVIKNVETLSQPFRQQLEETQRQQLYVNQNFEANQKLTDELDSLLTQGNELINQTKSQGGLNSILTQKVNQTISDVNARAGVIQAVMSARNGQISQAYNMIDRTATAINADRQDQLNYYKTLYDFYQTQKDEEGKKLITLTSEQRKYIDAQIGQIENDLKISQSNADNLKKALTDPDTALAYASAGVSLNDTPQQINQKLAKYAYSKEVADTSKDMAQKGYTYLAPGQSAPQGTETVSITDSKGVSKTWYKPVDTTKTTQTEIKTQLISNASQAFEAVKGQDGYINPQDWVKLRAVWLQQGGTLKDFIDNFSVYQNPNDTYQ